MKKLTKKWQLILYGCSGLGVNMLNMIVGSYLCSALLVGGFEKNAESWTYLNKDLVVAALWGALIFALKIIDGIVDVPMSSFTDNLRTRWGRRRPSLVIGFIPMAIAYVLFLIPINQEASIANTIWFALCLGVFYLFYTLTMLTYYATFSEITETEEDLVFLSNVKSICDVVYFSLSFALVPVFVGMGMNIRIVALLFMPLSLTMLIPLFMLKEASTKNVQGASSKARISLSQSVKFSLKNKTLLYWMTVAATMNIGLQLFLSGINEFFSTTGLNMTVIMACSFAPVPFMLSIYNKLVKKKGLAYGFRYVLLIFSIGMSLMFFCNYIPAQFLFRHNSYSHWLFFVHYWHHAVWGRFSPLPIQCLLIWLLWKVKELEKIFLLCILHSKDCLKVQLRALLAVCY